MLCPDTVFRASGPPGSRGTWWIEYLLASFEWVAVAPPAFVHTPHLKRVSQQHWGHTPSTEYVSGDRTFNSPVAVLEGAAGGGVALLADTRQLNAFAVDAPGARPVSGNQNTHWAPPAVFADGKYVHPSFPAAIDVQIEPPVVPGANAVLSFGMLDYEVEQHVYFKHRNDGSMVRELQSNQLRFGFDLQFRQPDTVRQGGRRLFQLAAMQAWSATGAAQLRRGRPQVMPFAEYAARCYPASLNASSPVGGPPALTADGAFVEWELPDGSHAGGLRTMAGGPDPASVVFDKIHNMFWWNNMHMATGFGLWGQALSVEGQQQPPPAAAATQALGLQLARAARLTLNMTLSAPIAAGSAGGLWDSVCTWSPTTGCSWTGALHKIAAPHTAACRGNPACDPGFTGAYWDFSSDWKSASAVSKTCVMLLRYLTDVERDDRILPRVKGHADWLVNVVSSDPSSSGRQTPSPSGRIPEWWATGAGPSPPPSPPLPPPPPPPPSPPLPPAPPGSFKELGNLDPNGDFPSGPFLVPSEQACQALCYRDSTCGVGVFLNGSVRHGECWINAHIEPPRVDFCGAKPGQSCAGFQRIRQQFRQPSRPLSPASVSSTADSNLKKVPTLSPAGWLDFNSHGGIHLQVLADFAMQLPAGSARDPYVAVARVIAAQLAREILPQQRWADVETFYSCSNKPESAFDNHTKQPPRNTLSTGWAVDGLTSMYELTGENEFLQAAEEAADYASLYQATYEPSFLDRPKVAYVFGGMRSQNTDAEWLDMRQTVISEGFLRLGNASGRQDLMERGVAAARASMSLITETRTQANNFPVPNVVGRPNISAFLEPENVDHEGLPQLPGRSGPDWGEVGGLAAIAYARHRFGGAFMDPLRGLCVGIDGVTLDACAVNAATGTVSASMRSLMGKVSLAVPWTDGFSVELRVQGLDPTKAWRLVVSGKDLGSHSGARLAAGVGVPVDGDVHDQAGGH